MFWMGGIGDSVHLPHICLPKDFFFYSCHHHSRAEPYSRRGYSTIKVHPQAQITHMNTDAGFKVRRLNSAGNTEDGREFHRTEVVGKKESPQQTSLELPMSTQNSVSYTHISEPT